MIIRTYSSCRQVCGTVRWIPASPSSLQALFVCRHCRKLASKRRVLALENAAYEAVEINNEYSIIEFLARLPIFVIRSTTSVVESCLRLIAVNFCLYPKRNFTTYD